MTDLTEHTGNRSVADLIELLKAKDQDTEIEYVVVDKRGALVVMNVGETPSHMLKFVRWAAREFARG